MVGGGGKHLSTVERGVKESEARTRGFTSAETLGVPSTLRRSGGEMQRRTPCILTALITLSLSPNRGGFDSAEYRNDCSQLYGIEEQSWEVMEHLLDAFSSISSSVRTQSAYHPVPPTRPYIHRRATFSQSSQFRSRANAVVHTWTNVSEPKSAYLLIHPAVNLKRLSITQYAFWRKNSTRVCGASAISLLLSIFSY
jgi:hypothetical protein